MTGLGDAYRLHVFDVDETIGVAFQVGADGKEECDRAKAAADKHGYSRTMLKNAKGLELCFIYRPAALRFITSRAEEPESELAIWSASDAVYVSAVLKQNEILAAIKWKFVWSADRCALKGLPRKDLGRVVEEFFPDSERRPPNSCIILYDDDVGDVSSNMRSGFAANCVRPFIVNSFCDKDTFTFRKV
jgi:hypothetical protein